MIHTNPFRTVGNGAAVLTRVVATKPCVLGGVTGHNNGASDLYIQIHEVAAVPDEGTVPLYSVLAFKGLPYSFALPVGIDLAALTVVASTTLATYTAASGTPVTIQAQIQGGSI